MDDPIMSILLENTAWDELAREMKCKDAFDSLDWASIVFDIEDEIGRDVVDDEWERLYGLTVGDLMDFARQK